MDTNLFSPYIRVAMYSRFIPPFLIRRRVIFDYELIYLAEGTWRFVYGNDEYICKKDDVILIKPGVPHSIENIEDIAVEQPHIHFDVIYDELSPKIWVSYNDIDQMSQSEVAMIREDVLSQINAPLLTISDIPYFKRLFYDTIDCFIKKDSYYSIECKQKMLALISFLLKDNSSCKNEQSGLIEPIESIKRYIDRNFYNEISLNALENQFYYSKFYISKEFTRKYKCSIIKYYNNLRIDYAKACLRNNMSVSDIAKKLNMNSIYSFSRFFKSNTGISPTGYRDMNKTKKVR